MATLKKALSETENRAAAERIERGKQEARVEEVQKELQALVKNTRVWSLTQRRKRPSLRQPSKARSLPRPKPRKPSKKLKIAAGKAFIMQSKHVKVNYLLLTRVRSSPGAFADLPRSVSDTTAFYRAKEGSSTEKVFWSQYAEAGHLVPLSDQLKQMVELHKVAEHAIKGLIVRLWPGEALPGSYFGLVRRLVDTCPWIEVPSAPSATKVPVGPLPVLRCTGARWTLRSL